MSMNTKLVLPVALGLSLVTVTAFVVYYVFKKDDEETSDKTIKTSRVNVIEVNVAKSIVPALIGRSGSNIKEIESKTGAMMHFKKFSDKEYDVCIIRGRSEATQLAETLIHDFVKQQPDIVDDVITVPGWACGRIIGTGGESINEISHRSGARIKIEGPAAGDKATERQISFRGTKEQIEIAKGLIANCVAQEKCRREIELSKRSPRHVPTPSPSPSPSPSPAGGEGGEGREGGERGEGREGGERGEGVETREESPGDASHRHVKYKRPESAGPSIEVYVSALSSPSRFWVQFVGPQVEQLDELVEHMTEYYSNKENRAAHALSHVSVGQVVAAVFRHDGRWYRARVHDIRPNEFDSSQQVADVFYLDYGDNEYVATHELCELRADLLRLRFQAMECFLAGVRPAGSEQEPAGAQRWHPQAVERFEELTQVARWKSLISRTCTYKKTATAAGEKDKEIPGIKLFDVTDAGEVELGAVLVAEGWAARGASPRASPPRARPTPFGDLTNSKVLGMVGGGGRSTSLPKDHKDDGSELTKSIDDSSKDKEGLTASLSLATGLEISDKQPLSISNFDLSYPDTAKTKPHLNGSHENFLHNERQNIDIEGSIETLVPPTPDDLKANINRIDSHHNLESIVRSQELHK